MSGVGPFSYGQGIKGQFQDDCQGIHFFLPSVFQIRRGNKDNLGINIHIPA